MAEVLIPDQPVEPRVVRRNRPGSKRSEWCKWPDQQFNQIESIHAQQMLIQQRIRNNKNNVEFILTPPEGADEDVWKYEHLRQFCQELNGLATRLQAECSPETCNQMTATDQWIFLCAAHKSPKECPAIDYTRHTLDGAALLLNSSKYFPSRVSMKQTSVAKLGSISRRIYRIFSHAFYHHKPIFLDFENQTQLCRRFSKFVLTYNLMPAETLIVPVDSLEAGLPTEAAVEKAPEFEGYATATIARATEPVKGEGGAEPNLESPSSSVILDSGSSGISLITPAEEASVENSIGELSLDDTATNSGEQTVIESEDVSTA
ncbi:Oidioi.mRNA.OKI2018_I69.chr2.g6447.t1.cds [Oikopleura dioica]|uniref:Oidioi.mRNA.OKI2018_I69.chr2.g6447.t1.cds n=1 Tax=Oikopleura dioica TaxID=34765 RepID=A0ABN7TA43_OIKDI|nr:Oidioi.mRNA.OKI2018_I69.chr2.g6447.t1.cds [Oikopleura dioica]